MCQDHGIHPHSHTAARTFIIEYRVDCITKGAQGEIVRKDYYMKRQEANPYISNSYAEGATHCWKFDDYARIDDAPWPLGIFNMYQLKLASYQPAKPPIHITHSLNKEHCPLGVLVYHDDKLCAEIDRKLNSIAAKVMPKPAPMIVDAEGSASNPVDLTFDDGKPKSESGAGGSMPARTKPWESEPQTQPVKDPKGGGKWYLRHGDWVFIEDDPRETRSLLLSSKKSALVNGSSKESAR